MNELTDKFSTIAQQYPDAIVMQVKTASGYIKYSYNDIYQRASEIATELKQKYNIKPGDRVAIILENKPEWAMIYFGILLAEAIAVPLDHQATPEDLQYCLEHSGSKLAFKTATNGYSITKLNGSKNESLANSDIASIVYTSGTTGKPKGVVLTHANFDANFQSITKIGLISHTDNLLSLLPLHHAFPFMVNLLVPFFTRAIITFVSDLSSDSILTCMRETGVTGLIGVPQLYYMLFNNIQRKLKQIPWPLRMPLLGLIELGGLLHLNKLFLAKIHHLFGKKLRMLVCGGAKLDAEVAVFFTKLGFKFVEGYGLTETAPVVTFNPFNKPKIGSVGTAIPDVEVKIADANEQGVGEIIISGPNVMQGYYKRPEETQESLRDGWFYSGDLGYLDQDNYLYIVGRKKELIVLSSGKNITPEEVEHHYAKTSFIKELCVLAVGGRGEDQLKAVIVPDFEYFRAQGEVNIYGAIKWNLESLSKDYPAYKRIMGFVLTKTPLPRTRLGKLKRFAIQDTYATELSGRAAPKTKEPIAPQKLSPVGKQVVKFLGQQLNRKDIHITDHLEMDLGLDSLSRVELMANLSREFRVNISDEIAAKILTVQELADNIEQLLQQPQQAQQTKAASWSEILQQQPRPAILKSIALTPGWFARLGFYTIIWLVKVIFAIFWRAKVHGIENLPKDRPFILTPNHNSYLDAFAISIVAPKWLRKHLFFLGYSGYFTAPVVRNLAKVTQVIPIDTSVYLVDAMQAAAYILRNNKPICIFPEGARSIDGKVKTFKKGVGILAKELNIEVVPTYIDGSYAAWSRGQRFPKLHALNITFGKPCKIADLKKKGYKLGAKDDYEAITIALEQEVIKLGTKH